MPVYGKLVDRRLYGHSGAYYAETKSIIVYGGYNPTSEGYVSNMKQEKSPVYKGVASSLERLVMISNIQYPKIL